MQGEPHNAALYADFKSLPHCDERSRPHAQEGSVRLSCASWVLI